MTFLGHIFPTAATCLAGLILCLGWTLTFWLLRRERGRTTPRERALDASFDPELLPKVSMLKPLKGLEEGLAANLESFYTQAYPGDFELIFASSSRTDPALLVARRIAKAHPQVPTRFVAAQEAPNCNPKVSTLQAAAAVATGEWLLQTDANVRIPQDFLRKNVWYALTRRAHLVTAPVLGKGERGLGAALENRQLSLSVLPLVALAFCVMRHPCVIGKAFLVRREEAERLRAFDRLRHYLCEDHLLGLFFVDSGLSVRLGPVPAYNHNVALPLAQFWQRHARWLALRAVIHPPAFWLELLLCPWTWLVLALVPSVLMDTPAWLVAAASYAGFKWAGEALVDTLLRGRPRRLWHLALGPLRDACILLAWCSATRMRTVEWRGNRISMGPRSRIRSCTPIQAVASPSSTVRRQTAAQPCASNQVGPEPSVTSTGTLN